jgi:hypothetical protein
MFNVPSRLSDVSRRTIEAFVSLVLSAQESLLALMHQWKPPGLFLVTCQEGLPALMLLLTSISMQSFSYQFPFLLMRASVKSFVTCEADKFS